MRKEHASDVAVANANVKKLQLQVASLEKALRGKVGRGGGVRDGEGLSHVFSYAHTGPGKRRAGSDMR